MSWARQCLKQRAIRAFATAAITAVALSALGDAAANGSDIYLPLYGAAHVSEDQSGAEQYQQTGSSPEPSRRADELAGTVLRRPQGRFSLIEMPPETGQPGAPYRRPHHAIGYRWLGAESWLREHGFDAQTCFLPMIRLHTKVSASADVSGTLWVYGRCSFR